MHDLQAAIAKELISGFPLVKHPLPTSFGERSATVAFVLHSSGLPPKGYGAARLYFFSFSRFQTVTPTKSPLGSIFSGRAASICM